MSHDPGDFDVEVLGHPAHGIGRKQSCETPTVDGVGEDLDASGRVDDERESRVFGLGADRLEHGCCIQGFELRLRCN